MTRPDSTDPGSDYFNAIGRIPMLTPAEEVHLAHLIQAGQQPDATPAQKRRGIRARNRMVAANLRLAVNLAAKLRRRRSSMTLHDLVQEATFGLSRAAEKFDPSLGYKFSTYAYPWINQALTRGTALRDPMIYIPTHVGNDLYRIQREIAAASHQGQTITMEEAALRAKASPHGWRAALTVSDVTSLHMPTGRNGDSTLMEIIAAEEDKDPLAGYDIGCDWDQVERFIDELPHPQRHALRAAHGLNGEPPATLRRIAKDLGISPDSARTVLHRAQNMIRYRILCNEPQFPDRNDHRTGDRSAVHLAWSEAGQSAGAASAAA